MCRAPRARANSIISCSRFVSRATASQAVVNDGDMRNPDVSPNHAAMIDQFRHHAADQADRDREADAGALSRIRRGDGRVHADQVPMRVEQRST